MKKQIANVRCQLLISGRVTMVGFRFMAMEKAKEIGLFGWVKNRKESFWAGPGEIELVIEGSKEKMEAMIAWCKKGPPLAKVEKVKEKWTKATGEFFDFEIRH